MEIKLDAIPYEHRFAAASLLMSRGNKLIEKADSIVHSQRPQFATKVLEAIYFFDMALVLIKPFDPNYQTLLNMKCQALISIGQFEDARRWYEVLLRIAAESDGPGYRSPTTNLALTQLASIAGKTNAPLPSADEFQRQLFDTPPFCAWAQEACRLLRDGQLKQFQQCLSAELRESNPVERIKSALGSLAQHPKAGLHLRLEKYEWRTQEASPMCVGWCLL